MKLLKKFFSIAVIAISLLSATQTASAASPLRFGVKAGVAVNSLKFDTSTFDSDNRAGFTGGVMTEFTVPIINLAFDASLLYTRRSFEAQADPQAGAVAPTYNISRDYIEIPINLKWKIGLPIVGNIITPFLTTGPDFSVLISDKRAADVWRNKKYDFAWNFGAGVELVKHLQIAASYGIGLKNSSSGEVNKDSVQGKNRFWTITAAWLF